MSVKVFEEEYRKLNKAQKEAVDSIEGPVMVVAGPGTGKTQILACRIANILKNTQTKSDSILCLTFTRSGVRAMRERLLKYIGPEAAKVKISTFHSFAISMLEKYFSVLSLESMPKVMGEEDVILLCDKILEKNEWEHLKPKSDTARYFRDLKSLISLLKRERITPTLFKEMIENEIEEIKQDKDNISTRGANKGDLKSDIKRKIEGLERTREAVKFYEIYEKEKKENIFFDYDDVLENLVKIAEISEEFVAETREQYLYILVDEHQDSSFVQNEFLEAVWGRGGVESPNIFVVGDDRQLIYGFSGAKIEYFDNFKSAFGRAKLVNLIENYRSTKNILDLAHTLLESEIVKEKLKSNHKENHNIKIFEADYERDEILLAGLAMREKIALGMLPEEIALLVPKNRQVKNAITILRDMGLPVSSGDKTHLFDLDIAQEFIKILELISEPNDNTIFVETLFSKISGVLPIEAYKFLRANKMRDFSIFEYRSNSNNLFEELDSVGRWINKIKELVETIQKNDLYSLIQQLGFILLIDKVENHDELVERIEIVRTFLHLVLSETEKENRVSLSQFISFIRRLEKYREDIPIASFGRNKGIKVMTFHGSKGLEFDFVWVAHLDEKSISGSKTSGFSLPEELSEKTREKGEEEKKRELYVALTRAKRFCNFSYARYSYTGAELELANIVLPLLPLLEKNNAEEAEKILLKYDPRLYIKKENTEKVNTNIAELKGLVAREFTEENVSVSLLNNFFECPWRWYFRNLLKLPEVTTESLEFGNVVHNSLHEIITDNIKDKTIVEKILRSQIDQLHLAQTRNAKEKVFREAEIIISRWVRDRLPSISKTRKSETDIPVRDKNLPDLKIYGKIDLIEICDNETSVTDFKTGKPRKTSEIEKLDEEGRMSDYMRQLAMYSYLLKNNDKWHKDVALSRLEFLEAKDQKDMFYETHIDQEKIDLLLRDMADYERLVKSGKWLDRPCNFKSYGKQDAECKYCKMSKIYLG